jgi:hypothetical protein
MGLELLFHYRPRCSAVLCEEAAIFKIAATWSDGTSRELKNYGLACERHREQELAAARRHHEGLRLAADEIVGPVSLYLLRPGCRDAELVPLGTEATGDSGAGCG